jgi:hypothetical protein
MLIKLLYKSGIFCSIYRIEFVLFIAVERSIQVAFSGVVNSEQVSYVCLFVTKTIYTLLFN